MGLGVSVGMRVLSEIKVLCIRLDGLVEDEVLEGAGVSQDHWGLCRILWKGRRPCGMLRAL